VEVVVVNVDELANAAVVTQPPAVVHDELTDHTWQAFIA
jgi:hypothetical protein